MNKNGFAVFSCILILALVGAAAFSPARARAESLQAAREKTLITALAGEPSNLDPALAYDTVSSHLLNQVYETLVTYNRERMDDLVGQLAESWEISPDSRTYTFPIRPGVTFHGGQVLTPSDVAYTFQRGLLQGGYYSPQYLLAEPFLGLGNDDITMIVDGGASANDRDALLLNPPSVLLAACQTVTDAITSNNAAGTVTMHLAQPWSPFLATLAGSWGSVIDQGWAADHGAWDGNCATWQNYYYDDDSFSDPLGEIENGTGPFALSSWDYGNLMILTRFADYWRAEPAWAGGPTGPAYFEQVTILFGLSADTRATMLTSGTLDLATGTDTLIAPYLHAIHNSDGSLESFVNPNGTVDFYEGAPSVTASDVFFVYDINPSSPYQPTGTWGTGIPADFFTDIHVRKAFNYAFDWSGLLNGAVQRTGPIIKGLMGYNESQPHYTHDMTAAATEMALAWSGQAAAQGFTIVLGYLPGNFLSDYVFQTLKTNIEALSAKYHVNLIELTSSQVGQAFINADLPVRVTGWWQDIPHPHNWVVPYLTGTYALRQRIPAEMKDAYNVMIDACLTEVGDAARVCYEAIQTQTYTDALDIFLVQYENSGATYLNVQVHGLYINSGMSGAYYYALYRMEEQVFLPLVAR